MENGSPAKTKGISVARFSDTVILKLNNKIICYTDDKPDVKDLRSNPPTKVKLPPFTKPSPPPVKDKPNKVLPK